MQPLSVKEWALLKNLLERASASAEREVSLRIKQETYQSSTLGEIPLSFTGRHLLQNLRTAVQDAVSFGDYHHNNSALSQARGHLANYISSLEKRLNDKT